MFVILDAANKEIMHLCKNRDKADVAHYIKGKFQRLKDYPMIEVCYYVDYIQSVFQKKKNIRLLGLTFGIQEHDVFPLVWLKGLIRG